MKKLILGVVVMATTLLGAESHIWLMTQTNVPGVQLTDTPQTLYGILVLMESDNPQCTAFDVTVRVTTSEGVKLVMVSRISRQRKAKDVVYGTAWASYFDKGIGFKVESVVIQEVVPE